MQNEDSKVSTENEKTTVEETVKEVSEGKKPAEDTKSNEPTVKPESPKPEEKLSEESKSNESPKQKFETVKIETPQTEKPSEGILINEAAKETVKLDSKSEKPSEVTSISEPAKETVKLESEAEKPSQVISISEPAKEAVKLESEAEKQSQETHINEPAKETVKPEPEAKKASEEKNQSSELVKGEHVELIEPSVAEKPSGESEKKGSEAETFKESINTEAALPEEKVIEVVPTDAKSVEKVTKVADAGTDNH